MDRDCCGLESPRSVLQSPAGSPAFTIIEVMLAIMIFAMVLTAIYSTWIGILRGTKAGEKVAAAYRMSAMIRELEAAGFLVFGAREVQRMEGGTSGPSTWPVAHLRVVHSTNPEIVTFDQSKYHGGTTGTEDV